jgi:hypothetical protein
MEILGSGILRNQRGKGRWLVAGRERERERDAGGARKTKDGRQTYTLPNSHIALRNLSCTSQTLYRAGKRAPISIISPGLEPVVDFSTYKSIGFSKGGMVVSMHIFVVSGKAWVATGVRMRIGVSRDELSASRIASTSSSPSSPSPFSTEIYTHRRKGRGLVEGGRTTYLGVSPTLCWAIGWCYYPPLLIPIEQYFLATKARRSNLGFRLRFFPLSGRLFFLPQRRRIPSY